MEPLLPHFERVPWARPIQKAGMKMGVDERGRGQKSKQVKIREIIYMKYNKES